MWITETWDNERLKDGGVTSASNETSVILYGDFGPGHRVFLTGDAGIWGLTMATVSRTKGGCRCRISCSYRFPSRQPQERRTYDTQHHPWPIKTNGTAPHSCAFVSAPKDDDTHPRKMVLNAFIRRGYKVGATQGNKIAFWGGFPARQSYDHFARSVRRGGGGL